MKNKQQLYSEYTERLQKIADVNYSIAILGWDKEVNLPSKGARFRSQQLATLSGIAHEMFVDPKLGDILQQLNEGNSLNVQQTKNVNLSLRDYERTKKLSKAFVVKRATLISEAYHKWVEAKAAKNFSIFKPALVKLIELKREEADIIGYKEHPYDALLDEYEAGAKTSELTILFKDVREQLVDFVKKISEHPQVEDKFLHAFYPKDKQWVYGLDILKSIGYDFEAGRQDISPHPFTTNFSPEDVRVTTRIDENDFSNMVWSCIHEGGHALYEQGLSSDQYGLPLGSHTSLGIHESQSRLWENNVGRSREFWAYHYKNLQQTFPENLGDVSLDQFYAAINKVQPNMVRTEADELHYHFHVLIRFELEKGLLEGSLPITEIKDLWNAKYKEYLDVDIKDDSEGILQDIHWSHGSFGYFPTYSLGSFYAAQFFHQAEKEITGLRTQISNGKTDELLQWLRTNIHQYGRFYSSQELCTKVTGEPLNFKYFMNYAKEKYEGIYK